MITVDMVRQLLSADVKLTCTCELPAIPRAGDTVTIEGIESRVPVELVEYSPNCPIATIYLQADSRSFDDLAVILKAYRSSKWFPPIAG